jgi:hypothetical protein
MLAKHCIELLGGLVGSSVGSGAVVPERDFGRLEGSNSS